jgi:membrane-bound lytic murein transglycosylase MltF
LSRRKARATLAPAVGYGLAAVAIVLAAVWGYGQWRATDVPPPPAAGPDAPAPPTFDPALLRAAGIIPPSPPKPRLGVHAAATAVSADVQGAGTALLQAPSLRRWTGDLDAMQERRLIRFLVAYNRTNFFIQDGRERGFEHELIQQFADFLNRDIGDDEPPFRVVTLPLPFEDLVARLRAGEGDVVAAGLTITPERAALVDFTEPYLPEVDEILVRAGDVTGIDRLEDLAGRMVHVSSGRSYAGHLRALSERLEAGGLPPIKVVEVDPHLETEDLLQLVNAGLIELTVADHHIASIWAENLPNIVLRPNLAINRGGRIAWAIRQDSPLLREGLDAFMAEHQRGTLLGNVLFARYFEDDTWISNPLAPEQQQDLARYADLFILHGRRYGFDWRLIAALAFQESKLDQGLVSPAGAVGLMQIKPETAAEPIIGLPEVGRADTNVEAGVKYLAYLEDRYFDSPAIGDAARIDLTLAAYNAGPRRVARMRARAKELDLDPNVWFRSVELVAFDEFSRETVDYVANINKYYVAYKLSGDRLRSRIDAIDALISQ